MTAAEARFNDYDEFARVYARVSETNPYNALYELPAILAMAGDVRGMRVLDAGCGPGLHAARLIERGAAVTGIDLSGPMLAVARERLGPGVPLHQADLTQPLAFLQEGSFDLVLSSLVMHYLERWEPALRELRRVLAPRGRLVVSTVHPFADVHSLGGGDYFGTYEYGEDWEREGRIMRVRFWHRPLGAMLAAFRDCGFALDDIAEPLPLPEMALSARDTYQELSRSPQFVIFSLTAS